MFKKAALALTLPFAAMISSAADAAVLKLDGYTSSVQTVYVPASPVPGTSSAVGATGFRVTDTTDGPTSFVAWCLDISHYLMSRGSSQTYNKTDTPFYNSYGISAIAKSRVQSVFDANYASLDASNADQAAAFQMVLWEAAYEDDSNALSMTDGLFQANSNGSDAYAASFIANATGYSSDPQYKLSFWEVEGEPDRARRTGQNLVSASPIPLPASGWLLLAVLGGTAGLRRRR